MTISMFEALDALAAEVPHHGPGCGAHDDVGDDECCIASAVISADGLE